MRLLPLFLVLVFLGCETSADTKPNTSDQSSTPRGSFTFTSGSDYRIDDQHSYLGFKIKYFGYSPVRGRFNSFSGHVFYDTSDVRSLQAEIIIDAASINTGNERRDNDLTAEDTWFDVDSFPYITFSVEQVKALENGGMEVQGPLTVKGITQQETFVFEAPTKISRDWAGNEQIDFFGRATINRQDYGVYGGDFWSTIMEDGLTQLSDEVEIELDLHCRRPDFARRYADSDPNDPRKLLLDTLNSSGIEAGRLCIAELKEQGELSSGVLSTVASTLLERGEYDHALAIAQMRQEEYPDRHANHSLMGTILLAKGDTTRAMEHFEQHLHADPQNTRPLLYLSYLE